MPALPFRQTLAAGLLAVAPLILSVALPGALSAQTVITVSPQECVWRAGDDPAWAAPSLNESAWQPLAQLKPQHGQTRFWIQRAQRELERQNPGRRPLEQGHAGL